MVKTTNIPARCYCDPPFYRVLVFLGKGLLQRKRKGREFRGKSAHYSSNSILMKRFMTSAMNSLNNSITSRYLSNNAAKLEGLRMPRTKCKAMTTTIAFVTTAGIYQFKLVFPSLLGEAERPVQPT